LHYLERHTPTPALFGDDLSGSALIMQRVYEVLSCMDPHINEIVQAIFRGKFEERKAALHTAAEKALKELHTLENWLTQSSWLAGAQCSAADIIMIPTFQRLLRALQKQPELGVELGLHDWAEHFPNLEKWTANTQELPAFDRAFPPHWKE